MTDQITLTGLVATDPRNITTHEGLTIASFRLASTQRRFDRGQNKWVDGETNWYTVTTFRQLAHNVSQSVKKGERIVVTGRLRIRDWAAGPKNGTNIEVDADAIGHDLTWGTSSYQRTISTASASSAISDSDASAQVGEGDSDSRAQHAEPGAFEPVSADGLGAELEFSDKRATESRNIANDADADWAPPLSEPAFAELPVNDGVPF